MNITQIEVEPVTWKVHDHRLKCGTESSLPCYACQLGDATHWLILKGGGTFKETKIPICDRCMNRKVSELLGMLGIKYREEG